MPPDPIFWRILNCPSRMSRPMNGSTGRMGTGDTTRSGSPVRHAVASCGLALGLGLVASVSGCGKASSHQGRVAEPSVRAPSTDEFTELVFDGGPKNGWQDAGWSPRETAGPGPARVHFTNWGGWILAKPGLGPIQAGALVFRVKEPAGEGEFLEVRVDSANETVFPRVKIGAQHRTDLGDGWTEVKVPLGELDPMGATFTRVIFRAFRTVDDEVTLLDKIAFTKGDALASPRFG